VAAYLALVLGERRVGQLLALAAAAVGLVAPVAATVGLAVDGAPSVLLTMWSGLLLGPFPGRGTVLATGAAEAVAVLCAGLPLAGRSVCALRRLPRVPASPPTATS
jgi:hypothetical protein